MNVRRLLKFIKTVFFTKKKKTINQSNIIVFGEWFGDRCCDNSLFLANYIASIDSVFTLYWIAKPTCDCSRLNKRIIILNKDSAEAKKIIEKAFFIIVNQGLIDITSEHSFYPKNSILINLWHGVAWKKIGIDASKTLIERIYSKRLYQNSGTDYFLSTSSEFSNIIKKAFSIKEKNIICAGYPRNNLFYNKTKTDSIKTDFIKRHHISDTTMIVSYLPTFRDEESSSNFDFNELLSNEEFYHYLESNKFCIVQKKHYINENKATNSTDCCKYIFTETELTASELLSITDVLITDYSSCFFDFLIKNKPIIHYIYDYDYYSKKDRGLYYQINDVNCGRVCFEKDELIKTIINYINNPYLDSDLRLTQKKRFMEYETNNSTKEIYKKMLQIIDSMKK